MSELKYAIIIPARFKSSRFEGKPLVKIAGKEMIVRVADICIDAIGRDNVYVATDDDRIKNVCENYNINVVMTSSNCKTGSDRVYEASLQIDADIFLNVQGDEPLLDKNDILKVIEESRKAPEKVLNAMCKIDNEEDFFSVNVPKMLTTPTGKLLYAGRAPMPGNKESEFVSGYKQVCIYAYPKKPLKDYYDCKEKTPLEKIEDIEILRFLEMGYDVQVIEVSESSVAVDTPEDLKKVEAIIKNKERL